MYGNLTRKIREVYVNRKRNHRPAKVRKLRDDIRDEVENSGTSSIVSKRSEADTGPVYQEAETQTISLRSIASNEYRQPWGRTETDRGPIERAATNNPNEEFPPLLGSHHPQAAPEPDFVENAVDEQAVRNQRYLTFEGEDETDYTKGPARLIFVDDGVDRCAGLLMTLYLSQKIQAAIRSQRRYNSAARRAEKVVAANSDFEDQLRQRISDHEYKIMTIQEDQKDPEGILTALESELTMLHLLLENTKSKNQCIAADLENETDNWRSKQAKANAYLEEAFVSALLLEPAVEEAEDEAPEELTVENEYEELCRQNRESNEQAPTDVAPLHDCAEVLSPVRISPGEEAQQKIKDDYWNAWQDLEAAQTAFHCREADRAREKQANIDADARGEVPMDESPDAFDQRWLERVRTLTRNLLQAEEAVAVAKANAREAGAREAGVELLSYEQTSDFVDHVEDGYRVSREQEIIASAPLPKITSWLARVPSSVVSPSFAVASGEEEQGVEEEWEAGELGLSDSASVVAEGAERKRIDKWRSECGH